MKKIIVSLLFIGSFLGILKAQETPPTTLKAVNAQFYINLADSAIWHNKGRAPDGSNYGWERLARYAEVYSKAAADARFAPISGAGYVPYTGATGNVVTTYDIAAASFTNNGNYYSNGNLNTAGTLTGGHIAFGSTGTNNTFGWKGAAGYIFSLAANNVHQNSTYFLPDVNGGTLALTSDLSAYLPIGGNAVSATKWATPRTLSITGDISYTSPSIDGTGNVTAVATLPTVNPNVGTYGSSTSVANFTVNAKGQITGAGNTAIQIAESQVTNLVADLAAKEIVANKTATQSSSTTTYPNWLGVTNALSSFGTGYIPNNATTTPSTGYAFNISGNGQVGGTFKVGSYVSTASTGISVSQLVTTANNHAIEAARVINPSSASGGVAEFDARTQSLGTFDIDHFVSYQARGKWSSSANTNNMNGLWVLDEMDGSGIVYSRNGVRIEDINKSGVGDLQNNIGLYVAPQLNGSLTNYNIVSSGGRNAFTGKVKIGSGGATNPTENLYVIGDTYLDGAVTTATGFRSSLFSGSKIVTTSGTSIVEGTTGTGVLTALGVNTGAVGAFVVNGGALGTPSSGTITNLSGTCASCTIGGSAATLTTTRTIWGQNFNGSANVSGAITGATSITANGIVTGVNLFATTTGGNPEVRLTPVTTGTSILSLLNVAGSSPIIGYQGVLRMSTVTGGAGAGTVNTMTLDASNNVNVTNALTVGTGATLTTSPTTSAGGYEILTRNTSTGLVEKITSTSVTANPMTTSQDIIVGGASGTPTRLAKGANNTFLQVNGSGILAYKDLFGSINNFNVSQVFSAGLSSASLNLINDPSYTGIIQTATLSAPRTYALPDASGTIDLGFKLRLTGSGTGAATTISIAHGLTGVTSSSIATVQPINSASTGISYITTDATNVNIVYTVAPVAGTNNLSYNVSIKP